MKRKTVLVLILAVMLLSGGGIGGYYWYQGTHYVHTEDARLAGDIYRVMPQIAGKLVALNVKEGDYVVADQPIGQQDSANLPNNLLGNAILRSPIEGTVIKTLAKVGEVVSPGQTVAMIVDKSKLYVTANIEETYIKKLHVGEPVDFTIDSYPGVTFTGKVIELGEATASTFSLLPAINTSGNFTKVTQRIPVKISIDSSQGLDLEPGMSAVVNIHING